MMFYEKMNFDVPVGTKGDCFDRYCIRIQEMRESLKIVLQCINEIPEGSVKSDDRKISPPSRSRHEKFYGSINTSF